MKKLARVNIKVDVLFKHKLERAAEKHGKSVSEYVRRILEQKLKETA